MTTAGHVDSTPAAVMWSIGKIAERDQVSKQAVSKKVKALVDAHGLQVDRDPRQRIIAVNVAAYDHLRSQFGDPSKVQAPKKSGAAPALDLPSPTKSADSLEEAKRQQAWIDAERSKMRFAEEQKLLVRVGAVIDAVSECGVEISRIIDRLPGAADDLAAAVGRDGAHGVRVALKTLATKMREDIAATLAAIAGAAPELEQEPQRQLEEHHPVAAGE
jgi:hypothetical protein